MKLYEKFKKIYKLKYIDMIDQIQAYRYSKSDNIIWTREIEVIKIS